MRNDLLLFIITILYGTEAFLAVVRLRIHLFLKFRIHCPKDNDNLFDVANEFSVSLAEESNYYIARRIKPIIMKHALGKG
jgi:hypothetical protein